MLYLGVDGGNTKTIALVCGADGRIAGHARTGCSDVYSVADPELAVGEIVRGARRRSPRRAAARSRARTTRWRAQTGRVDIAYLRRASSSRRVPAARTIVVNDAIGAIRCGADDGVGCSFVCGTGTAIGARAATAACGT